MRVFIALAWAGAAAAAALPPGCTGSASLGTFRLLVRPFSQGSPLPLKGVAEIPGGSRLVWNPLHLTPQASANAEVTAVLVPSSDGDLLTLEPRKAGTPTEWQLPERPQVIALLFGPQGLSEGKIKSLVTRNRELLRELADYAEQSSEVESLVQQLANAEQAGSSADSVLKGLSSQYGVAAPKLDTKAPSNDQATLLLKTFLPASNAYDPLAAKSTQVQQSGGLAASVAGMFFGNPVALAAGGAALFTNLKTAMFPTTDFRSAFAQFVGPDGMALCTKNLAKQSKTRTAYLWAYRVPEIKRPVVALARTTYVPLGSKSVVAVTFEPGSTVKELNLAREWRLMPSAGGGAVPVDVSLAADSLEIDLSKSKAPAGEYRLEAGWDWGSLPVAGTIDLRAYSDFAHVNLAPGAADQLVEGNGAAAVTLTGADFEFLERAAIESSGPGGKLADVSFSLPKGKRAGPQDAVTIRVNPAKPGSYRLLLSQSDGVAHEIPITILPSNPEVSNLPVRVNLGETREAVRLEGSGMSRIESVTSAAGAIAGRAERHGWSGTISLAAGLAKGQTFPLELKVQGLGRPVTVPDAIEIVGPRPRIRAVQKSLAGVPGIEIGPDELPAGTAAGLVLTVEHLAEGGRPRLDLRCEGGAQRQALAIAPGETAGGASLTFAGPGALYLSIDAGAVGYAGCRVAATISEEPEGRSDPFLLGRVIRIPQMDKFTLSSEKVGDSSYAGRLEGRDLDVIEKAGWDAEHGVTVEAIPAPVAGDAARQTLRIVLPWPAPAPHAPLYVWLRGEAAGRRTAVAY